MNKDSFRSDIGSLIPLKTPNLARTGHRLHRPDRSPRCARRGARGSAPMRRGAAPFGKGCEQNFCAFAPHFLSHFVWIIGFETGINGPLIIAY